MDKENRYWFWVDGKQFVAYFDSYMSEWHFVLCGNGRML